MDATASPATPNTASARRGRGAGTTGDGKEATTHGTVGIALLGGHSPNALFTAGPK
jgi:hypothetical protein